MKWHVVALALVSLGLVAQWADAQGYYRNGVRRNPYTGQLEIVDLGYGYQRWVGPSFNQRGFYGSTVNPYTGTQSQSIVRRNPFTGHIDVQNDVYNPWTGARVGSTTRYNPFTQRYETYSFVQPSNRLPAPDETARPPADGSQEKKEEPRKGPRIIETKPLTPGQKP